ncbi:3-oxoacyl-ACP reductase [Candidatus Epulonipiscioides gigas]|nr:3-oxoacyl-ACP reductase [Epulopiscium sp. SCG-C07WGA-EpuloA2]
MLVLEGKNALITGCNRGIGAAILEEFAKNGANIWAHARKETPEFLEKIKNLSEKYKVAIEPIYFDLEYEEAIKSGVKQIIQSKKPVDILVNNAGITLNTLFQLSSTKDLYQQFNINFFAPFILTQYIVKLMTKYKSGSIINISSTSGIDANFGRSVYGSSKAALICMSKVLATELGNNNIRVNCIAPGIIETEMLEHMEPSVIENAINKTILRRKGLPEDVANTAVFLASDESSYITGQVLRVDGGLTR